MSKGIRSLSPREIYWQPIARVGQLGEILWALYLWGGDVEWLYLTLLNGHDSNLILKILFNDTQGAYEHY